MSDTIFVKPIPGFPDDFGLPPEGAERPRDSKWVRLVIQQCVEQVDQVPAALDEAANSQSAEFQSADEPFTDSVRDEAMLPPPVADDVPGPREGFLDKLRPHSRRRGE